MRENDYNVLIQKADELRSLFVLGQKVIPFLEDIFNFLKDTQPLFEEINQSINENLQKMPSASMQLSKVTQESEKTTNQIMDMVDSIITNAESIEKNTANESNSPVKILKLLHSAISDGKDLRPTLPMLGKAIEYLEKPGQDSSVQNTAKEIVDSANAIMMSLQIQDITSQQLASVDHLIKSLQYRLKDILDKFSDKKIDELAHDSGYDERTNVTQMHREIAFDSDAVNNYDREGKQDEIDAMFESGNIDDFDASEESSEVSEDVIDDLQESTESNSEVESEFDLSDLGSLGDDDDWEDDTLSSDDTESSASEEIKGVDEESSSLDTEELYIEDDLADIEENDDLESVEDEQETKNLADEQIDNLDDDTQFSQDDIDALFGG